jgi:tryptophan synthase alpha chain
MKNRITTLFERKNTNILSVFYTAGFPTLQDTLAIAEYLQEAGVDMMEIGIPFSDPVADGPIIQASNTVALKNGMTVPLLLEQLKEIRKKVTIPIVLMGYLNPVYQYGVERFIRDAKAAGADGLILPDMPLQEFENDHAALMQQEELCMSFLMAPTTSPERIEKIDSLSTGFVYAVSASSTTGNKQGFSAEQESYFQRLKSLPLHNPRLIGFGISDRDTFSKACRYASGAIVGSAFIKMLQTSTTMQHDIQQFVKEIRGEN